jgi:hypothetical protein
MSAVADPTPDLVTAAVRILLTQRPALLGAGVGPEEAAADAAVPLWVFQWETHGQVAQGSGKGIVVVSERAGWTGPNRHNTLEFPRLQVEIYADSDRERGFPDFKTAQARAKDIWRVVDLIFHRPDTGGITWGDVNGSVRVVSSLRGAEPDIVPVPDGDGAQRLLVSYNVELG